MKKLPLLLASAALLFSCNDNPEEQKGFTLTGTIKSAPDSTLVILNKADDSIDSTYVLKEKFSFTGQADEPYHALIDLPTNREYAYVWIENSDITFSAEYGNLSEAVITGSQTQKEDDLYMIRLDSVDQAYDDIIPHLYEKDLSEARRDSLRAITAVLKQERFKISQQFIREYPNSHLSLAMLDGYKPAWGKEITKELFEELGPELQETKKGKEIAQFIKLNVNPQIGDQYVDIELNDVNGEPARLSEVMGKVTLIEFWASNCGPCRKANPEMVADYVRFSDKGFEIYAVTLDTKKDAWIKAIKEDGLPWKNVGDMKGKYTEAAIVYGVFGIPDNFLIDKNGTIIARKLRGEGLTKTLEELFGENLLAASESGR